MKTLVAVIGLLLIIIGCNSTKTVADVSQNPLAKVSDTVKIANDSLEYEVIIIDPGFSSWLSGRALPRGYYSENYLEVKNQFYVTEWNRRAMQPSLYDTNLYEMQINYDMNIHYGYEVNYLIYNYFIYFQNRYNQRLGGFVPVQ
ncbi:MAG: hypothetical protein C0525_01250 [Flavobacterium sp.]|uniref:DUF6146 family protein n=1 Tax=Flavobacterium sp. TaxID=239 RepID=UPI0025BC2FCB|nr:DUF6146 family protein [Flavobacterium sp.]MBA4133328.1 hypothetical protein [Flavobacterium sp.]